LIFASEVLASGLEELGLDLETRARRRLQDYAALLAEWNRAFNLVARADVPRLLERHLLDSLSVWRLLEGENAADMGSGAGLPGIPLAIATEARRWTLIERSHRKARFLREARRQLGLDNVEVVQSDVADVAPEQFDTVVARAFGPAETTVRAGARLCRPGGAILLMSGRPGAFRPESTLGFERAERRRVWVPILNRAHVVQRFVKTPARDSSR
jgi:16S rRNA (guanine527-N7)-methyltransferase